MDSNEVISSESVPRAAVEESATRLLDLLRVLEPVVRCMREDESTRSISDDVLWFTVLGATFSEIMPR